ncbi:MAG: RNA polymerase sigma factor [Bacteroidota bacterium]
MDISIQLIERCLSNDRTAQNGLYRQLLPYLNVVCQRYLYHQDQRQDVLQEAFIRIFRHLAQFDVQHASFKTWVTKIAINCCLKSNAKREKRSTQELILPLHESLISPEVFRKMSNEDLMNWLRKMPPDYYEVFNLFMIDGFSHREIAELLEIDEALSRQRLARGRAWIKKKLPEEFRSRFRATMN